LYVASVPSATLALSPLPTMLMFVVWVGAGSPPLVPNVVCFDAIAEAFWALAGIAVIASSATATTTSARALMPIASI
jgi:hypothetical protein